MLDGSGTSLAETQGAGISFLRFRVLRGETGSFTPGLALSIGILKYNSIFSLFMNLRTVLFGFFLVLLSASAFAQQNAYYVVIGVFKVEENAQRFMEYAHTVNVPATYALNPVHNLYYVYVRSTANKGSAYDILKRMQEEGFIEAWVFKGGLGQVAQDNTDHTELADAEKPVTTLPEPAPLTENGTPPVDEPDTPTQHVQIAVTEQATTSTVPEKAKPAGKPFVFKLLNGSTGREVTGQVHLLESDRTNKYQGFNGNEMVYLTAPANKGGRWYMTCQVIGFQPVRTSFVYATAEKTFGAPASAEGEVVIPFELTRVRKGDYIEMDSVKFFENSNIFTPESARELNELVAMMAEDPGYRIRLHGHTNGEQEREIVSRGEGQDFFGLDAANNRTSGNAKQLSTLKAESVRDYLVSKGIDGSRISVRGEGGTQPIFDPRGSAAANNDRVEVEITKH
jgi:outer membrane protein OmpA-like peptidoglycan-associated protein